jgi:hypothetical protein
VLTNAIDQVLIESPTLETGHGKHMVAVAILMTYFELGEGHRTQTGIEMEIEFGFGASLAIAQAGELFGVAKEKLDLETRFVIAVEPLGLQVTIGAEEHRIALALGVDDNDDLEIAFQLHMIEHLMIQHDVLVFGLKALKAR